MEKELLNCYYDQFEILREMLINVILIRILRFNQTQLDYDADTTAKLIINEHITDMINELVDFGIVDLRNNDPDKLQKDYFSDN